MQVMNRDAAEAVIITIGAPLPTGDLLDVDVADASLLHGWLYSLTGCVPARVHDSSRAPKALLDLLLLASVDHDLGGTEYVWQGAPATDSPFELVTAALVQAGFSAESASSLLAESAASVSVRGGLDSAL